MSPSSCSKLSSTGPRSACTMKRKLLPVLPMGSPALSTTCLTWFRGQHLPSLVASSTASMATLTITVLMIQAAMPVLSRLPPARTSSGLMSVLELQALWCHVLCLIISSKPFPMV
uniref:Uncharacterized protein n=1 Tax=Opuntia streptacantha TaxID=393608 RepID=A0A7C8ZNU8_OPUST